MDDMTDMEFEEYLDGKAYEVRYDPENPTVTDLENFLAAKCCEEGLWLLRAWLGQKFAAFHSGKDIKKRRRV